MSRVALNYGNSALYIGPSPASGHHFLTYSGKLNSDFTYHPQNRNLVADLARVQSLSYDFNIPRHAPTQLGKTSTIARPIIDHPTVGLAFDWLLAGIKNEARLGLTVNYARFERSLSGVPYYPNNTGVDILSGLKSRDQAQPSADPFWPAPQREPRNLYLAVSKSGEMVETPPLVWDTGDSSDKIDFSVRDWDVAAFGNCYLLSYWSNGQIGQPPRAGARMLAENLEFHPSGSGAWIPALNPVDRTAVSGRHFRIPSYYPNEGPACLKPGDILLDLVINRSNVTGQDLDIDFRDMWIDSYAVGLNLDREPLRSVGLRMPYDHPINYPVFATVEFQATVNENQTGRMLHLVDHDHDYNIAVKLRNPTCPDETFPVPPYAARAEAVRYDFVRAKLASVSWSQGIGGFKRAGFSFSTELAPDDFGKGGFFMSGLLNIDRIQDMLCWSNDGGAGDGDYLITPSGDQIVIALLPVVV